MNERGTEVLKQYDLQIINTQKTRGAILCETNEGRKLLKEYRGTVKRLEFEYEVLSSVTEQGYPYVDNYIRNKSGEILSTENGMEKYILKNWFDGRECQVSSRDEVLMAVRQLAILHKMLRNVTPSENWSMGSVETPPLLTEYEKHNKELKRARNYIRNKRKKTDFELRVIESYDLFFGQAAEALLGLSRLMEDEPKLECKYLCHGEFSHHHILFGSDYTAIIEFSKMHMDVQLCDLYHFMRKIMEKNNWDLKLADDMLYTYQREVRLERYEMEYLYYLFLYPEKYWKQINFYYNASKAWIPSRHIEKLRDLEDQFEARRKFLETIW